jgi:hypothetical protein
MESMLLWDVRCAVLGLLERVVSSFSLGEADWFMCNGEGRWNVRLSGRWRGERAERLGTAVREELEEPASDGGPVG